MSQNKCFIDNNDIVGTQTYPLLHRNTAFLIYRVDRVRNDVPIGLDLNPSLDFENRC